MSQQDVADAAKMSLRAYSDFENGKSQNPQGDRLERILAHVGIADDETATETREGWPADVQVFLDMLGAWLSTKGEAERLEIIHEQTRRIFLSQ